MKKRITTLFICLLLTTAFSVSAYAATPGTKVTATIPTFKVTMNGQVVDNTYREYPFLIYNDITYFPMTYWDMRFLGVSNTWTAEKGSVIVTDGTTSKYNPTLRNTANKKKNTATISTGKYNVNGVIVNNATEEYPILSFRDVPYFPLTWNWCQEFGWNINFNSTNGLTVNTIKGGNVPIEKEEPKKTEQSTTQPFLTATKTDLSLTDAYQSSIITINNADGHGSIHYEVKDTNVVRCEWGKWDGYSIPLYFKPVATGETTVTVYLDNTDDKITINVSVYKPTLADEVSLTIEGIGETFTRSSDSSRYYSVSIIDSVDYKAIESYNGTIRIDGEVIVRMVEKGENASSIIIDYDVFDDRNICVYTGSVYVDGNTLNQPYLSNLYIFDLKPGNYRLVFKDVD